MEQSPPPRLVQAADLRAWLLWLAEHYDPQLDTPENRELRRLGGTLEALGRHAGAIASPGTPPGASAGEAVGSGACLLASFDWEHGTIEVSQPYLLRNRLGSPDAEALITRLVAVTGIAEHPPAEPPAPEYMV